jgi:hypothetical protein
MPKKRRLGLLRREPITRSERRWARGELGEDYSEEAFATLFLAPPERLRLIWKAVHDEPIAAWLHRERVAKGRIVLPGPVIVFDAVVGKLDEDGVRALQEGRDPWDDSTKETR